MLVYCTQPNLNLQARFWIEKAAETESKKTPLFHKVSFGNREGCKFVFFLSFIPSLEY